MRKEILTITLLTIFTTGVSAQRFTAERDADRQGMFSVYRPVDFLSVLDRFDNTKPGQFNYYEPWDTYVPAMALDEDISKNLYEAYLSKSARSRSRLRPLFEALVYYDRQGTILTIEFRMDDRVRKIVSEDDLKAIYNKLMKERVLIEDEDFEVIFSEDSSEEKRQWYIENIPISEAKFRKENKAENCSNELFMVKCNLISAIYRHIYMSENDDWFESRYYKWKQIKATKR